MTGSIFVRDASVATFDSRLRLLKSASAYIEDGRFIKVGRPEDVRPLAVHPDVVIDGHNRLVMPGLVNTHVHLAQSLLRSSVPDDVTLLDWLTRWVWPIQGSFEGDDGRISAELTLLEMIRGGTTAFIATSINGRYKPEKVTEAVHATGMRAALGRQVMDIPAYASRKEALPPSLQEDKEASLKSFEELRRRWDGRDGRLWIWLSPRTPGACSDSLFREMASILGEHNTGLTMHLAEIQADMAYFTERGTTPAKFLREMGLLRDKTVYVHCVWLSDADIREFARRRSTISHNPSSNMKLGSGIAPVVKMLRAGANVAIGTDGGPSNDTYDMLREIRLVALLQKVAMRDPRVLGYGDALKMAVTNGYRAMGLEGLVGRVESGYKADFIILDLDTPHLTPSVNLLSNVVYSATGQDVSHVFVDGKALMMDRKVTVLDEEKVLVEARKRAVSLIERAGLQRRSKA